MTYFIFKGITELENIPETEWIVLQTAIVIILTFMLSLKMDRLDIFVTKLLFC